MGHGGVMYEYVWRREGVQDNKIAKLIKKLYLDPTHGDCCLYLYLLVKLKMAEYIFRSWRHRLIRI